jgi:glycosyltransferase involved in cell wall biosynthesis
VRRWKAPIVYDIDEPIFIPYVSPRNGHFNRLKFFSKVHSLFEMSDHVLAVNQVIADYAANYARRISIVPMAVDTERYQPPLNAEPQDVPRIGWVGTLTNQPNLELVTESLHRLQQARPSVMRVIADEPLSLPGVEVEFIPWTYDIEVPRLQECQIGIVPVKPSVWSPWKFFFKLIQFMSLGLPVVATPTGSNLEIIKDGVNGFLASSSNEWYDRLSLLMDDADLRRSIGEAARETVKTHFSLTKQLDVMENIFRNPLTSVEMN